MTTIDQIVLTKGVHDSLDKGACVMELASYLAHQPWSDHPACVSPVLGSFLRLWNDSLDDDIRQRLKPYASRILNTAGDGKDEARAWMCTDWLARVQLPAWLDLAGLTEHSAAVRALGIINSSVAAKVAQPKLDAAWAAAGYAARAAAGDAAWYAAGDAALAAAGAAARAAAGDAATKHLAPTVVILQASAFELLDRMLA